MLFNYLGLSGSSHIWGQGSWWHDRSPCCDHQSAYNLSFYLFLSGKAPALSSKHQSCKKICFFHPRVNKTRWEDCRFRRGGLKVKRWAQEGRIKCSFWFTGWGQFPVKGQTLRTTLLSLLFPCIPMRGGWYWIPGEGPQVHNRSMMLKTEKHWLRE